MNASRRIARKHNVLNNGLAMTATFPKKKAENMIRQVVQFITTSTHKRIAAQANKLGLTRLSPLSEHRRRNGVATR